MIGTATSGIEVRSKQKWESLSASYQKSWLIEKMEAEIVAAKRLLLSMIAKREDTVRFAFTVPSINKAEPAKIYERTVLPQGMKNSPTMCQLYVAWALQQLQKKMLSTLIYHFMDDILLCQQDPFDNGICDTIAASLKHKGLIVAPEKVQQVAPWNYLGWQVTYAAIRLQKLSITPSVRTLHDVQKLVEVISHLIRKGRQRCKEVDGKEPEWISVPIKAADFDWLLQNSAPLQLAIIGYSGSLCHGGPSDKRLQLKYVHVSIDTYSGLVWATAQAGEKSIHVIRHLTNCFAIMGVLQTIKTANAPAYVGERVQGFLTTPGVEHITGIPHLSTGQAIVERANRTLKMYLQKQKESELIDPQIRLCKMLFTLNYLSLSRDSEQTPVQLRYSSQWISPMQEVQVTYKDPKTGQWVGPKPLLFTGRGYSCVSTDSGSVWEPCRWTRAAPAAPSLDEPAHTPSDNEENSS
ncbi:hypothetical protein WISP_22069 [Willisornis vidua]|uniref:ribonuclease H n=1 Tax=Willisornis vidua TaxID=1566151 RepID=A0ABQ9DTY2_9PASS|nr:hypothetical protein WISP_22069 [Willisornis vidua]